MRQAIAQDIRTDVGRELGFDMYRFNIPISEMMTYVSVEEGYKIAQTQNVSKVHKQSMYTRKLLYIRMRAYRKEIVVSITEKDIEAALNDCNGKCPVTGISLTSSTLTDSDWSVDRLDNDRGYEPNNIVVMSSAANKIKDDIPLIELIKYGLMGVCDEYYRGRFETQDAEFWQRMLQAYARKMPNYMLSSAMVEICTEEEYLMAMFTALNYMMFETLIVSSINQVEKVWRSHLFLSKYIKNGAIRKGDELKRLRKAALSAVKTVGDLGGNFNPEYLMSEFTSSERASDVFMYLLGSWMEEIETSPERRRDMLLTLIERVG
ncbi:hypothetical protein [Methylophaga sp.]|jgi:hypothetical protein|uniref:hypothetical protein n=1 Tax=Methylophaga sp. TaxID=2024840 RepID=UPI0027255AC6|nr:hypothetical protein [Methylophaga sp.]MDO8827739.1 hypothetical protein [Methylophaga sp.]